MPEDSEAACSAAMTLRQAADELIASGDEELGTSALRHTFA